jgi:signal recognition particle subunit SEC65
MKEYERHVIWLVYFDSERRRNEGRRVPLSSATKAPKLQELEEACRRLNLQPSAQPARHPRNPGADSGYVSIRKAKTKQAAVLQIAKELAVVRGISQRKEGRRK